jgi:zinc transporter, ZIP family
MTALIRQIPPPGPSAPLELPVPPTCLRTPCWRWAPGLLLMAGLAAVSTFWDPPGLVGCHRPRQPMVAGVQASLLAALATAVGALPVFLVQRVSKRQESAFMAFAAGVMLAAAVFALLLPSLEAGRPAGPGRRSAGSRAPGWRWAWA